jgi:hypothetical protein
MIVSSDDDLPVHQPLRYVRFLRQADYLVWTQRVGTDHCPRRSAPLPHRPAAHYNARAPTGQAGGMPRVTEPHGLPAWTCYYPETN